MYYEIHLVIPAATTEAAPAIEMLTLAAGIVGVVEVEFPSGSEGLVHVRLGRPESTWLPSNPSGDFASDDYVIRIPEHLEVSPGNNIVKITGWAPSHSYGMTIPVRIGVLPREVVEPVSPLVELMRKFFRLVGVR